MTEPRIIATIDARNGYDGLIAMFRARIVELGTCIPAVDEVAGLPQDYTGKVLRNIRTVGRVSLGPLLGALGIKLVVMDDHEADYKVKRGLNGIRKRGTRGPKLNPDANANADETKTRKGRILRAKFLLTSSSSQRSNIARHAASVRWQKYRARKARLARRRELRKKLMEVKNA